MGSMAVPAVPRGQSLLPLPRKAGHWHAGTERRDAEGGRIRSVVCHEVLAGSRRPDREMAAPQNAPARPRPPSPGHSTAPASRGPRESACRSRKLG